MIYKATYSPDGILIEDVFCHTKDEEHKKLSGFWIEDQYLNGVQVKNFKTKGQAIEGLKQKVKEKIKEHKKYLEQLKYECPF